MREVYRQRLEVGSVLRRSSDALREDAAVHLPAAARCREDLMRDDFVGVWNSPECMSLVAGLPAGLAFDSMIQCRRVR